MAENMLPDILSENTMHAAQLSLHKPVCNARTHMPFIILKCGYIPERSKKIKKKL